MTANSLTKNIRNSELTVPKEKRSFLTYHATGLATCTIEELEDSVDFIFDTTLTQPADKILDKRKWEQFRFLINCVTLESLDADYAFDMSLDNLIVDINLMPLVLLRDMKTPDSISFLSRYKALAGCVLLPKYKYENYINGGQDLYKKHKLLTDIANMETTTEIQVRLLEEYHKLLQETEATHQLVPKKSVLFSRVAIPVLAVALAALVFFGGRMLFVEIPFQRSVIAANTAYIHGDFLTVQRELRGYSISRMSDETKYFLARSYVATEALTHAQITNILIGLARLTDPIIFEYWISLGRLYFTEAVDIAQRLGDDELLLFAYLKQIEYVRNDMTIPGAERIALLSYLENHIDRLNRNREEAEGGL